MIQERTTESISLSKAAGFVKAIAEHYLGRGIQKVTPLDGDLGNYVFELDHDEGSFVVRLNPDLVKLRDYNRETIVQQHVRRLGIPAPELLHVGIDPVPFEFSRKIKGESALNHPARLKILHEFGAYARLLHSIPTYGYGATFTFEAGAGETNSWSEFLVREWEIERRLDVLLKERMIHAKQARQAEILIERMKEWTAPPALNHGNLRLKNVLVDPDGKICAILDWEGCLSVVPPYFDLAIALSDLAIDAKEAFLQGYGVKPEEIEDMAPYLKLINVLNAAPEVEAASARRDKEERARLRTRLTGSLDLYSLC